MPSVAQPSRLAALFGTRVPGVGPRSARLAFVGERPGKNEARRGVPFTGGAAGAIFDALLVKAGIQRGACYVTNLVRDYQDHPPEPWEIARDEAELAAELRGLMSLAFIGTLGAYATRWFLGAEASMELVHGIAHLWGEIGQDSRIVLPIYHPASGLYETNDLTLTYWDLLQLKRAMSGETGPLVDEYPQPRYERAMQRGIFRGGTWAVDTEGYARDPWMASFSNEPGAAAVYRPGQFTVGSEAHVILHNAPHDLPVLAAMGVELGDGQYGDTMLKAYSLGGIHPQGLKPLAYRLCGMRMKSYEELMSPVERGLMLEYLRLAAEEDWGGRVGKCLPLGTKIRKALRDAEEKGADPAGRYRGWPPEERGRIETALGPPPRATLDDLPEPVAVAYSGRDADATGRVSPVLDRLMDEMRVAGSYQLDLSVVPAMSRMRTVGVKVDPVKLGALGARFGARMAEIERELGLNPDSGDQVADLLFTVLRLPASRMTKKGRRWATDDKVLEAMRGKHPAVPLIIEYRECSKLKSNFCQKLIDARDEDGRIHTDLGMRANSGRFTAKEPNLLAVPTRTELGRGVRDAVVAAEGRVLGDWDLNQIEMRIMADESGDEALLRVFRAGGDVHSATAADMYGIPVSQVDELKHRYPAKRVGFGVITGITGHGLLEQFNLAGANRGGRWTEAACDDAIEAWFGVHPGVRAYMEACRAEARRYGFVRDRWGRIRYLPGVWAPIARIREEAERQAHSHKIQGGAAGAIKCIIRNLWPWFKQWRAAGRWAEMLLPVHDELLIEAEDDSELRAEMGAIITGEMESAVELSVPIKAAGAWGHSWKEAKGK